MLRRVVSIALCFLAVASFAWAQTQTGRIFGQVVDPDGNPLPGVTVTVTGEQTVPQTRVTDVQGRYLFQALPPGEYRVEYSLEGFQTLVRDGVRVSIAQTATLDAQLSLSQVQETVTITGEAPMVDVKDTTVQINFSEEALQLVPSARDVWSILEHQAPAVVTDRNDVGGSEQGLQAIFSARGSSWQQNTYKLNGVTVTDPAAIGASGFYYDYDSFEEIQVSSGSHAAEVAYPGIELNLVTKSGGNQWHGGAQYYYTGAAQADNVSADLRPIVGEGSRIDYISDGSAQIGGPIKRDKLWFFSSYRDWRVFRFVPGFPEVESTEMPVFLIKPSWQVNENHKVDLFYTRQTYFKPNRNASATVDPTATWIEDDVFSVYQAQWQAIIGQDAFVDARGSFLDVDFPLKFQPDAVGQATIDLGTGYWSGPAPIQFAFRRKRWAADIAASVFRSGSTGTHDVKIGLQYNNTPVSTKSERVDDVLLLPVNGQPFLVQQFSTPNVNKQTIESWGLYASDAWTIDERLTVVAGVRFDTARGWLPKQGSLGGNFYPAQSFPKSDDQISGWGGVVPRLSVIYQLPDDRTAIKASGSLYRHQLGTGFINFANPNGTITDTYLHNDLDGDGQFDPGEEGAFLGQSGGNNNRIDPGLDSGKTSEFTAGVEHEFSRNWMAGVTFIYRKETDLPDQINTGIDFDRDFQPVQAIDPGRDGIAGTGDDRMVTVYNQVSNIGVNQLMLTNVAAKEAEYKGVEFILRKRFSDKWQMQTSLTIGDAEGPVPIGNFAADQLGTSNIFLTPNDAINSRGKLQWDRPYIFKISGSYLLPYDILVAGALRSQSGLPIARIATITAAADGTPLGQGPIQIQAEPRGSERLDAVTTIDFRAGKEFDLPKGRIGAYFDIFNLTNEGTVTSVAETGTSFLTPTGLLGPRVLRLGFRYSF